MTKAVFHTLFLSGVFFIAELFRTSRNKPINNRATLRDENDGGTLGDDIREAVL
jgi:hypothetical protein